MHRKPVDTKSTIKRGFNAAIHELKKRGGKSITPKRSLNRKILGMRNSKGKEQTIVVKTRTSGTWQGTIKDGDPKKIRPNTYWLFVDLSVKNPEYFIVPDNVMRKDIKMTHDKYLKQHHGQRPQNKKSNHHAIALDRICQWKDKWHLLNL